MLVRNESERLGLSGCPVNCCWGWYWEVKTGASREDEIGKSFCSMVDLDALWMVLGETWQHRALMAFKGHVDNTLV
jgi:hypothetical protein